LAHVWGNGERRHTGCTRSLTNKYYAKTIYDIEDIACSAATLIAIIKYLQVVYALIALQKRLTRITKRITIY
jgi:hypothetical protein